MLALNMVVAWISGTHVHMYVFETSSDLTKSTVEQSWARTHGIVTVVV